MSTQPLNKLIMNMQQISFLIRDLMILSSLTRDFLSDSVGLTPSEDYSGAFNPACDKRLPQSHIKGSICYLISKLSTVSKGFLS